MPPQGRSMLELVTSEPHRLMFFCGALQGVAAFGWWFCDVASRYLGAHAPPAWSVPPMWAHAWLLLYGLFPFFIFGFLMTAGPNWLDAPKPSRSAYIPAALAMMGGIMLFFAGLLTSRGVAAAGLWLHFAGVLWGLTALVRLVTRYWNPNARYAFVLFTFLTLGAAGSALFAIAVSSDHYDYASQTLRAGVWSYLLPIFVGVSTRMVPFFSSRILGPSADYRPGWARPFLMISVIVHGVLELNGADQVLWLVDLPLAAVIAHLAWRWGLGRSRDVRLLAVLHVSLAVLACAFLLYGVLSLGVAVGRAASVGLAPLHLLAIGYFTAMTIAMVSRVSLGHSGRLLEADPWTWSCYLGILLAAVLRASSAFAMGTATGGILMGAASIVALTAFAAWAWRYVPLYLKPRMERKGTEARHLTRK